MKRLISVFCTIAILLLLSQLSFAQYRSFALTPRGDTINIVDKKGLKQGRWVITVPELRGEPGYDEEGEYKDDKKEGVWRRYTAQGDLLAMENYKYGGKDGIQQYFSFLGELTREESWHSYNPDAPYDTIPVYGQDNNEIIQYKIVKAAQYSVPHGEWKYYEGGMVVQVKKFDRGTEIKEVPKQKEEQPVTAEEKKPKEKAKPQEVLDYEKKYSKKKRQHLERQGQTSL